MNIARITAKGRTTIPISIRKAANLNAGDTLAFEIKEDYLIIKKIVPPGDANLKSIEKTLLE